MRRMFTKYFLLAILLVFMVPLVCYSQEDDPDSCKTIIDQFKSTFKICKQIHRGWACYGNYDAKADPKEVRFYRPGHRQPISTLNSIVTSPEAGAAILNVRPQFESSPLRIILFSGATLGTDSHNPNAFTLRIKDNKPLCEDTPSAMVVFTKDRRFGSFSVNDVKIELHSTVFITMKNSDTMAIANVEGEVVAKASGMPKPIPEGKQANVRKVSSGSPEIDEKLTKPKYIDSTITQFLSEALGSIDDSSVRSCGGEIKMGDTITRTISERGQECLFTFFAENEEVVTITLQKVDELLDPYLDLRGSNLTLIAANNDRSKMSEDSLICDQKLTSSGENTIVVRSNRNQTVGKFRLTLNGPTDCTIPPCQCKVKASGGLNLRDEPNTGENTDIFLALPNGTIFKPLADADSGKWYKVYVKEYSKIGWIRARPDFIDCEPCIDNSKASTTPAISVKVSANKESVNQPGEVKFKVVVTNTGEEDLTEIYLTGELTPGLVCTVDDPLKVGEFYDCAEYPYKVPEDYDEKHLDEMVVATAWAGKREVLDHDLEQVLIGKPSNLTRLNIEAKVIPDLYNLSDCDGTAGFTLQVTNLGNVPVKLNPIEFSDPEKMEWQPECKETPVLEPNETYPFPCSLTVTDSVTKSKTKSYFATVTAAPINNRAPKKPVSERIILNVKFECNPKPPCRKCGPFLGP